MGVAQQTIRIIGVFDNQVKLIKYDYAKSTLLGTDGDYYNTYSGIGWDSSSYGTNKGNNDKTEIGVYYWNYSNENNSTNTWSESRLNTTNLNTNYLNNIGTNWSNKIATHAWKIGGNTWDNIGVSVPQMAYTNEITSPAENTTYDAKIGLMYVSDYYYAAESKIWGKTAYDYRSFTSINWMYMGLEDWAITRVSNVSNDAFYANEYGYVFYCGVLDRNNVSYYSFAIRPCFYLNSNVTYKSGAGTISSPFIIE